MALNAEQAAKITERLYNRLVTRRTFVSDMEQAFRGERPLAYATDEWAKTHSERFNGFSDNWCGVVGSAPGERTAIDGFRVGDDRDVVSSDERELWRDWEINHGPAQASQGFLHSTVASRSFVLVWGDEDDEPVMTWERADQVIIEYDPERPLVGRYALKSWVDDETEYSTLYSPAEVWKFERPASYAARQAEKIRNKETGLILPASAYLAGGEWKPRQGVDKVQIKNPMGLLPIVEFPNRPILGGEPMSDIQGAVAMQDAINLLWAYLFTAADFASMPARVVMGQEMPKIPILDANGQKIGEQAVDPEQLKQGRMLWLTGQDTSIGQWDAAKLDVFTSVVNVAVKHLASQTRTPIHYIVGDLGNVNGETLTATETPLAMKVRESHNFYTTPTREVFRRFALVRGNKALAEEARTGSVRWRNPETRSDAQLADAAIKDKSIGFPLAYIAENRYGMTQPEIERLMSLVEAEQEMRQRDALIAGLLRGTDGLDEGVNGGNADVPPVER